MLSHEILLDDNDEIIFLPVIFLEKNNSSLSKKTLRTLHHSILNTDLLTSIAKKLRLVEMDFIGDLNTHQKLAAVADIFNVSVEVLNNELIARGTTFANLAALKTEKEAEAYYKNQYNDSRPWRLDLKDYPVSFIKKLAHKQNHNTHVSKFLHFSPDTLLNYLEDLLNAYHVTGSHLPPFMRFCAARETHLRHQIPFYDKTSLEQIQRLIAYQPYKFMTANFLNLSIAQLDELLKHEYQTTYEDVYNRQTLTTVSDYTRKINLHAWRKQNKPVDDSINKFFNENDIDSVINFFNSNQGTNTILPPTASATESNRNKSEKYNNYRITTLFENGYFATKSYRIFSTPLLQRPNTSVGSKMSNTNNHRQNR